MRAAKRPKCVKVGGHVYRIAIGKSAKMDKQKADGLCEVAKLRITLRSRLEPSRERETLVHEILHAGLDGLGLEDELEERIVLRLADQLHQVIRDNPDLVSYLIS